MILTIKDRRSDDMATDFLIQRLEALATSLTSMNMRYRKYREFYGGDYDEFWEEALRLVARECLFSDTPTPEASTLLDSDWTAWAKNLLRTLQDSALDLCFKDEEYRLNEFVADASSSRPTLTIRPVAN